MTGQGQPPVEHSLSPLALLIEAGRDQGRRRVVVVSRPVPRQRVQKLRAWRETARDKWRSEKRFFYSCESWRRRTMETSFLDSAAPSFECQRPTNEEKKTWALPSGHPQRNGRGTARRPMAHAPLLPLLLDPGAGARGGMPVEALVRLEMPGSGRFRRPPVGLAMAAPTCSCQIGRTARLACTRRSRRQTKMVHAYRARRRLCNVDLKRAV